MQNKDGPEPYAPSKKGKKINKRKNRNEKVGSKYKERIESKSPTIIKKEKDILLTIY